ncbi:hypothetical protein C8Q74DRAFT_343956 [Fomes fomentarius]|nr:hypothetical protein C8Q74DRAFT_343956 [Fomes fomentarius]
MSSIHINTTLSVTAYPAFFLSRDNTNAAAKVSGRALQQPYVSLEAFAIAHICRLSTTEPPVLGRSRKRKHGALAAARRCIFSYPPSCALPLRHHPVPSRLEEVGADRGQAGAAHLQCRPQGGRACGDAAFRRFLCEYEPGPGGGPPGQEQEPETRRNLNACAVTSTSNRGLLSATRTRRARGPRRFYFLTGHITLAVGCVSRGESSASATRAALEEVFEYATRLTSLAVEDLEATLCAVPRLVRLWSALPCLRRFAVGYEPATGGGSSRGRPRPTETPSRKDKDGDGDRDAGSMEEMEKDPDIRSQRDRSWESDRILRSNSDRGTRFQLSAVRDLYVRFGSRRNVPLGLWVDACPDMRRLHVVTDESAALMMVLRVSAYCILVAWSGVAEG